MEQNNELDPRIQIELENLNTATEEINKLEIELEEANSTFRILLNESTRRLKLLSKKLGSCIEKSRPYYDSVEKARLAQIECQLAAAKFQRANEIHAAAKETVALAEERFMSNSHNWPFDNAWQEMLNHATIKVMDAEKQKAESHAEHQIKAHIFSLAEMRTQQIEERQRRNIQKSRPYFEEKQLCQDQLQTQKDRIQELQLQIQATKASYATSLKNLEQISEEIHKTRGDLPITPPGPREPGVGAELCTDDDDDESGIGSRNSRHGGSSYFSHKNPIKDLNNLPITDLMAQYENDFSLETVSLDTTSMLSEDKDDDYDESIDDAAFGCGSNSRTEGHSDQPQQQHELNLEELRQRVKVLAARPLEGGDGQTKDCWESELNDTVNKLDRLMMLQETSPVNSAASTIRKATATPPSTPNKVGLISSISAASTTPTITPTIPTVATAASSTTKSFLNNSFQAVQQKMEELLPTTQQTSAAVMQNLSSMKELPLLSRISNEISANTANTVKVLKRRLSLN